MMRAKRREAKNAGAAFIESVVLLVALTITLIGVLTLYSMTWRQFSCKKIFGEDIGPAGHVNFFNPSGHNNLEWIPTSGREGCYHYDEDAAAFIKLF
jgi:hypothetical protein